MAREDLDPHARHFAMVLEKLQVGGEFLFLERLAPGASTQSTPWDRFEDEPDVWLRLERAGNDFIASASSNGQIWAQVGSRTIDLPQEIHVGIAASETRGPNGRDFATASICDLDLIQGTIFRRGDANADGRVDLSDAIFSLSYLFLGKATPQCLKSANFDGNKALEVTDAIYLLGHLFLGGPAPPEPFSSCGIETTAAEIELSCDSYKACR
jgi:hypothetical protein